MNFFGKNGLPSRASFVERKKYREKINYPDVDFIDLWYESPNYGLYNSDFEPVILLAEDKESTMSNFGGYAPPDMYAASFVIPAFNSFRESYLRITRETSISFPPFIDGLVPKRAHVDFQSSYANHVRDVAQRLLSATIAARRTIFDFRDFMEFATSRLMPVIRSAPITKSGFLLSDSCPIGVSGLCIELANLPYDRDLEKGQFLQTVEFKCYADVANQAGFYVDKNLPWRLIANLNSGPISENISKYFRGTPTENILARFFRTKTHYDDFDAVQRFFVGVYNQFIDRYPLFEKKEVSPSSLQEQKSNMLRPPVNGVFDTNYWIGLLFDIRHAELNIKLDEEEMFERKQKVLDLQTNYGASYSSNGYSLKPALGKIGLYCSEYLRSIYENKSPATENKKVTIKDYV